MRNTLSKTLLVVLFVFLPSTSFSDPQRRVALTTLDLLRVAGVSDVQISPNGDRIVYSVSTVDGNETVDTLWLSRLNANSSSQTTSLLLPAGWKASNARWSPDGARIAFLSNHNSQDGIWVVSFDNREPRFVAEIKKTNFFITYAGEIFSWSGDSKRLAFISATEEPADATQDADNKDDPRVIDRIQYKSRTSFSDTLHTHVFVTTVERPEPRQLTEGRFYDHAVSFAPNGNEIAFLSNREPDPDANNNSDIFAVDMHGELRQVTATRGCEYEPTWSPNGRWIAYTATKRDVTTIDSVAEDTHLWITDASGKDRRELTADQDRRARDPQWSDDSDSIFYLAGDRGCTTVFSISSSGGKAKQVLPNYYSATGFTFAQPELNSTVPLNRYQANSFSVAHRRSFPQTEGGPKTGWPVAFSVSAGVSPGEVWFFSGLGPDTVRVTGHNLEFTRAHNLVAPEELSFRSFDGTRNQGWLMKPVGWREDRKYPLILAIHGGPHGMYGWAFNPTFQIYAAQGYAVLYLNPRGSSGYGQKFSDGTLNEWGGGDYRDLMAGVDEALRRNSWIDAERMGVTGGSYGGFMTNWVITQTPRFKAAVAVASLSNLVSFYSTSLYQDLIHAEFGGFPWDNYDLLWQWSPLRYVKQVQTPTMFIHGEQDNDVHITQAEEMYTALKRRGVESVFVRYPREGHGFREPKHRLDALERTLKWFDKYLK
jgi:dipeptidyl aminopeptidase/acylaminoacyl peptidase